MKSFSDGKEVETKRAIPRDKGESGQSVKKLFVGGLRDVEDADMAEYFSQFGNVTNVDQLVWRDSGKKRGYGYIEFSVSVTIHSRSMDQWILLARMRMPLTKLS